MIKFSKNILSTIFKLFIVFIVIKAFMVGLLFFLPHTGVEKSEMPDVSPPYVRFNTNAFYKKEARKKRAIKPKEPLYKIDNMELTGIYMESNERGYVVFYDKKDKKQHILSISEEYKGYRLDRLSKYQAIFTRDGKSYKLTFKKDNSIPIDKSPDVFIDEDEPIRMVPAKLINKYRRDFKAIWKNISINEVVKNGKIIGFKIYDIKKNSVFDQLGLKKGDVIIEVNEKPMNSYKAAFDIYQNISKYRDLKIKILRNGAEKEFYYEVY